MTAVRAEVVDLLLVMDPHPSHTFTHADGAGFSIAEANLALDASGEERVAAAEIRLAARGQAAAQLRTALAAYLEAAGVADRHVTRVLDALQLNLARVPHPELLKLFGPDGVGDVSPATLQQHLGADWTGAVAKAAGMRRDDVQEILTRRTATTAG